MAKLDSDLPINGQRLVSGDITLASLFFCGPRCYGVFHTSPGDEIDENIEITREIRERARHQRQVFAIFAVGFELGLKLRPRVLTGWEGVITLPLSLSPFPEAR